MRKSENGTLELDYTSVNRYWNQIEPSILGPYMMDGFGFPKGAGRFRFRSETRIVENLVKKLNPEGTVLDLGSGIGYWAEFFARNFARVVAVEGSESFFKALKKRAASYSNMKTIQGNVMEFEPEGQYELIFLGGLLMYLNESDLIVLMRKLVPFLAPGGVILCRESTVREGTMTRQGEYQATYRSVAIYEPIFNQCGLAVVGKEINAPYVLLQMGCEIMKCWKKVTPRGMQMLSVVGHLVYSGLRLGNPWITRIPRRLGVSFPELTNHFFLLQPDSS